MVTNGAKELVFMLILNLEAKVKFRNSAALPGHMV